MMRPFSDFRELSCVVLGGITGALIALPWALSMGGAGSAIIVIALVVLGGLVGYRKRKSVAFFYLCLVSVIALASLISRNTNT